MNWAPIIPLIGGFSLGAFKSTQIKPTAIYSYSPFAKNDSHLCNYWKDVPYYHLDVDTPPSKQLDLMVATPPCAGLSQLNSGKKGSERGAGGCAVQNEWMYRSTEDAIRLFSPKVIIGENAPALYTKMGQMVAEQLTKIARENGYSLALYKTSTILHGLPQKRDRTFYFLFKSKSAPILNWYRIPQPKTFEDWLRDIPESASQQDMIINPKVVEEPYFNFLKSYYRCDDPRDKILEDSNTAHAHILRNKILDKFIDWAEKYHEKGYRLGLHAKHKYSIGKGVWDGSVHIFRDHMNALIGRALHESIHPYEDRSLNVREALHTMGFPHDFELLDGLKNVNHIAQNVPVNTASCMVNEGIKFLNDELRYSEVDFLKLNNIKQTIDTDITKRSTLETFIG